MKISMIGDILSLLPKMEGTSGKIHLNKSQIELLGKGKGSKFMKNLTKEMENPSVDVAYKAKSNYNIAYVKVNEGEKTIANGAVSVVNPGKEAVIKYRASLGENGNAAYSSGFVDAGQKADAADITFNASRKNGIVSTDARAAKAAGFHADVNEDAFNAFAEKIPGAGGGLGKINRAKIHAQDVMNDTMERLQKALSPKPKVQKAIKPLNADAFEKANAEKMKSFDTKLGEIKDAAREAKTKAEFDDLIKKQGEVYDTLYHTDPTRDTLQKAIDMQHNILYELKQTGQKQAYEEQKAVCMALEEKLREYLKNVQ